MVWTQTLGSAALLASAAASAFARPGNGGELGARPYGRVVVINSPADWCMFLPSDQGRHCGGNVDDPVAFCTTPEAARQVPGAKQLPDGFVVSAHFRRSSEYVQVAGRIDQRKCEQGREHWGRLAVNGETGLSCSGYRRFVNLVDPDAGLFCIRCCNGDDPNVCNTDHSELGCEYVANGDYELQSDQPNLPSPVLEQTIASRSSTAHTGGTSTASPTSAPTMALTGPVAGTSGTEFNAEASPADVSDQPRSHASPTKAERRSSFDSPASGVSSDSEEPSSPPDLNARNSSPVVAGPDILTEFDAKPSFTPAETERSPSEPQAQPERTSFETGNFWIERPTPSGAPATETFAGSGYQGTSSTWPPPDGPSGSIPAETPGSASASSVALSFSEIGALAASAPEYSSNAEGPESPSALPGDEEASLKAPEPPVSAAESSRSFPLDILGSRQSQETGLRFPSVASPTFRFVTTAHEGPILVSANSGCVDLDPSGSLDWSALNRTISYASVAIPGGVSVSILFFVEEGCAGIAVYDLEKKTIATGLPTVVDILPDFYGNYLGPQSAAVSVTKP